MFYFPRSLSRFSCLSPIPSINPGMESGGLLQALQSTVNANVSCATWQDVRTYQKWFGCRVDHQTILVQFYWGWKCMCIICFCTAKHFYFSFQFGCIKRHLASELNQICRNARIFNNQTYVGASSTPNHACAWPTWGQSTARNRRPCRPFAWLPYIVAVYISPAYMRLVWIVEARGRHIAVRATVRITWWIRRCCCWHMTKLLALNTLQTHFVARRTPITLHRTSAGVVGLKRLAGHEVAIFDRQTLSISDRIPMDSCKFLTRCSKF